MLHILLIVLKIIGIILLILLGLVFFALLTLLFVPFRYKIKGCKEKKDLIGEINLSWLFHLVFFTMEYKENFTYECYICGIPVFRTKRWMSRNRRKTEQTKQVKKKRQTDQSKTGKQLHTDRIEYKKTENRTGSESMKETVIKIDEKKPRNKKKENVFRKFTNKIKVLFSRISKIWYTLRKSYGKLKEWKAILYSEDFKWIKRVGVTRIKSVLGHVKPKSIRGDIEFGFEDPADTGELLGVLGILYPVLPKKLNLIPNFTEAVLEGWLEARGRVYGVFLLKELIQILLDGKTIPILRKYMRKEA